MEKEKFLKGILGGFIGSLVGVIAILFFYKLGYVAAVAGLIMAVCTINLYQKFSGGIDKKGIISCIIIMIVMTIVGNNLAFSFAIVDELKSYYNADGDVVYIFLNLFELMSEGIIDVSSYVSNLLMIAIFNVTGSIGVLKNQFKKVNVSNNTNSQINHNIANYSNETIASNNQINQNNGVQNNLNSNYNNVNNTNLNNANNNSMFNQNQISNNPNQFNNSNNFDINQNNMKDNNNMM